MAETDDSSSGRSTPESKSIEMILRRSLSDCFKDYIHNCSLAGAKQMCDTSLGRCQRAIWATVFCLSFGTVCYFLNLVWTDTLSKPLIVNLESTEYPIENIDFPAIAICNVNRISKKALEKLAIEEYADLAETESLEEVEQVLANLGRLIDYSYNDNLKSNKVYLRFVEKYRFRTDKIIQIMKKLTPSCEDMIIACGWDAVRVDCDQIIMLRRTANRGFCCTFNYVLSYNQETKIGLNMEIRRQKSPGFLQGLTVLLDPLLDDYAYPMSNMQGFDILIFDPMHYADPSAGRVSHRLAEPNSNLFLEIKSTKQTAAKEIRKYFLETRHCLFHDEMPDMFDNLYSYSTCIVQCRILTIQDLCKCTPFFFAANKKIIDTPVCSLEDLPCLNKYREKFFYLYPTGVEDTTGLEKEVADSLDCTQCLPDCEITQYFTKASKTPMYPHSINKTLFDIISGHTDMINKTMLSIYHPTTDATLVQLDVVSYWYEVISNIGGFCGIIIGFSLINIVEIFYFFTIRFIQHFCINYRKYH